MAVRKILEEFDKVYTLLAEINGRLTAIEDDMSLFVTDCESLWSLKMADRLSFRLTIDYNISLIFIDSPSNDEETTPSDKGTNAHINVLVASSFIILI